MTLRADIATGETTLDRIDLRLEGALPLVLARRYRSGAPAGLFGVGWEHGLDRTLRVEADRVVYREGSGRETVFAPIPVGMEAKHPEGLTLQRHPDGYVVFASPLAQEVFRHASGGGPLLLERIVDPSGNRIKLVYAGTRLAEVTGAGGQRIRFSYAGHVVGQIAVAGADGRATAVRTFRYGTGNTLVAETDAAGRTTEYAYQDGLLVRAGTGGAVWLAQYDGTRRCTAIWRADGTTATHLAYDPLRQTTRSLGLDGRQVLHRHALGASGSVVLEREDAEGERLNYYYDEAQRLIGHSAPGGGVATFQRLDPEKGEQFQIDFESRFLSASLAPSGLVATIEGGGEAAFAFEYDERFRLVRLTTPLGSAWGFERDSKGRVSAVASPTGRRLTIARDGAKLTVEDGEGLRLRLTFDLFGRVAVRTDRSGREQRFRYDAEGRLADVELSDGYRVTWETDGDGRPVRTVDSERTEVRRVRDGAGRVLAVETGREALRLAYDLAGRAVTANGERGVVQFEYDEQDRLVRAESPSRAMTFAYDDGHLSTLLDGRRRVYSPHGEGLEDHTADGRIRRFLYGASGELLSVEYEGGEELGLVFEYDDDGRLVGVDRGDAAVVLGYDPEGLLTTAERAGATLRLDYDARFRPAALHVGETAYRFRFDEADRLTAFEGEGTGCTFQYDALDRCTAFRVGTEAERPTAPGTVLQGSVGGGVRWIVAPRGIALVADGDGFSLPLWGHEEVRRAPLRLDVRIVRALVLGAEAAVVAEHDGPGPPTERWQRLADARGFEAGVPSATALGVPWPALDFFALARDRYDPHFARRLPGTLPHHQPDGARSPDDVLTGSHRTGVLQPPLWAERAHGLHLASAPLASPGGISDELTLRLYRLLNRA